MRNCTSVVIGASMFLFVGCSQPTEQLGGQKSASLSDKDNEYFKRITIGNKTEISSSQLALQQSQNPSVRTFAQQMITDHTQAGQQVMTLASAKGVTPPAQMDEMHQKMVDALRDKTGPAFDKAYAELQVTAHREVVMLDEEEANNGNDPRVKDLATTLLPTLKMHLDMAKQIKTDGSGGGAMGM